MIYDNSSMLIKALRKKHKMTQEQFAKMLHVSKSNISKYENGVIEPSTLVLEHIEMLFPGEMNEIYDDIRRGKWDLLNDISPQNLPFRVQRDVEYLFLNNADCLLLFSNGAGGLCIELTEDECLYLKSELMIYRERKKQERKEKLSSGNADPGEETD